MTTKAHADTAITGVLKGLGYTKTDVNHQAMYLWQLSEGVEDSYNNPWATSKDVPGAKVINSDGVKRYPSLAVGIQATVLTIQLPAYKDVRVALKAGTSLDDIYAAINASPWCKHCSNGRYPLELWKALGHKPHRRSPGTEPVVADEATGQTWAPHVSASARGFIADRPTTQGATDAISHLFL